MSGTPSPSWSLIDDIESPHQLDVLDKDNNSETNASQISPTPLLFKSDWSELEVNGQLSKEQTHKCSLNISISILSTPNKQSFLSLATIQIKFLTPSPSMSSSQISGVQSLSISHLYFESVPFFIAISHTSAEFIWTVHWFTNATHLFTSTELVNNLSHAVTYAKSKTTFHKSGLIRNFLWPTW